MQCYRRLATESVPSHRRELVDAVLRTASLEMGVPMPVVYWYTEDIYGEVRHPVKVYGWAGWNQTWVVHLWADAPLDRLIHASAHEFRHLFQEKTMRYFGNKPAAEEDARRFAYRVTGILD